jgi:hypothetical protein
MMTGMDDENESGPKEHVAVRLEPETIARIEALRPLYEIPGRNAMRALIFAGLKTEEPRAARLRSDPEG